MCFYAIATNNNGPLEAAHALIDDDRYDIAGCGAIGRLQLDLQVQLHGRSITSTNASRMSIANVLVYYCHRV